MLWRLSANNCLALCLEKFHTTLHGLTFIYCGKVETNKFLVYCIWSDNSFGTGHWDNELLISRQCWHCSGSVLTVAWTWEEVIASQTTVWNVLSVLVCICFGGGFYVRTSTLVFTGNSTFRDNPVDLGGGVGENCTKLFTKCIHQMPTTMRR